MIVQFMIASFMLNSLLDNDASMSFAEEVEAYNNNNVYFARSRAVRLNSVEYSVGDVVRHTIDGYQGVIVGWDYKCQVSGLFIIRAQMLRL